MKAYLLKLSLDKDKNDILDCKIGLFMDHKKALAYLEKRIYGDTKKSYAFSIEVLMDEEIKKALDENEGLSWMDEKPKGLYAN